MEVSVDGEKKSLRPRVGENIHIDLSGLLYFGGIEPGTKKQRAVDQGILQFNSISINLFATLHHDTKFKNKRTRYLRVG